MNSNSKACFVLICVIGMTLGGFAQATTLSWSAYAGGWTPATGTPTAGNTVSQQFDNDSSAGHAGNDMQVSITNSNPGATWSTATGGNPATPEILNTTYTGGFTGNAAYSLTLQVTAEASTSSYIQITINFLASSYANGVKNVSFSIFDVDKSAGQFIDIINNIQATTVSGATIGASTIAPVSGATYSVSGSGTGQVVTGTSANTNSAGQGTVNINFGSTAVNQVSFRWSNSDPGLGRQGIGLYNISYDPVVTPEANQAVLSIGLCLSAIGFRRWLSGKELRGS